MKTDTERERRRRKGQTLAEFALTLPILLLLMFGIIEFGRIFQAWVTLQNAARAAARYASTGQFYDKYQMNFNKQSDPDSLIPCVYDDEYSGDQRGTQDTHQPNGADPNGYTVKVYRGGLESLFATWNDGRNCNPADDSHQDMRKDMARILSIMEEARRGASGLALEENSLHIPADSKVVEGQPWYEVWKRPYPRSDQRAWFHVMICSSRPMLNAAEGSTSFRRIATDTGSVPVTSRFVTYVGDSAIRDNADVDLNPQPEPPGCLLNEKLPETFITNFGMLDNAGIPWMDPGGPGDSVTVIVTFNHPLVTPIGLAPYIQMQARRTAIVESFRAARAVGAINNPGAGIPQFDTPTFTPSFTPSITPIPSETPRNTAMPTATPTSTPRTAFDCDRIDASGLVIQNNTVMVDLSNDNDMATVLTRVIFHWRPVAGWPDMYVSDMGINGLPHWHGRDNNSPTDTNADPSDPPFAQTDERERTIAANDVVTWGALFSNGPNRMQSYTSIYDYGGTQFYFLNPLDGTQCIKTLNQPTPTPSPEGGTSAPPSPTRTPDCASADLRVRFVRFEQFGIVVLEVVNDRNQVAPFTDFTIRWKQVAPGVLTLARVNVFATNGSPGSVLVWQSGSPTQDSTPPTSGKTEGTWVQNYTFSPNSVTRLYIDFDGISSRLDTIGMSPVDLNGSEFIIGCGTTGSGGSGGGGGTNPSGRIILDQVPTPRPTNTPGPSNTPAPTFTPSKVPTKGPNTATPTPGPTKVPTNTPPPTATNRPPTNTPIPTQGDMGDAD